jgi:hypothetical protein
MKAPRVLGLGSISHPKVTDLQEFQALRLTYIPTAVGGQGYIARVILSHAHCTRQNFSSHNVLSAHDTTRTAR